MLLSCDQKKISRVAVLIIDENSYGEMMSEKMAKKKKYLARIYRVNDPSIVYVMVRS